MLGVYHGSGLGDEAVRLHFVMLSLGLDRIHPAVPLFIGLAGALLTTVPFTPAGLGLRRVRAWSASCSWWEAWTSSAA